VRLRSTRNVEERADRFSRPRNEHGQYDVTRVIAASGRSADPTDPRATIVDANHRASASNNRSALSSRCAF
jgi:hypothetical protein